MFRKKLSVKLLLLLLVFILCSCTAKGPETSDPSDTVSFCDAAGYDVSVKKGSLRAACLTGSFADAWALSGGVVVACADDGFDDFGISPDGVTNLGKTKSPDLEKLIASSPDFVIASVDTAANVEMGDVLREMGLTVIYFEVDCFDDYLYMLDICTDITERKDLYQKNGIDVKKQIEKAKSDFFEKDIPDDEKTYLFLRASAGYIRAKGSDGTILGEMLSDLGYKNIADSDSSLLENLSIESILSSDPHYIFVVQAGDDTQAVRENMNRLMSESPAWQNLSAVQENRLLYLDKRLFNLKPNSLWGVAYETLCSTLTQ